MSPPSDSFQTGSSETPDVLRQLAQVFPLMDAEGLESQLQTFDTFIGMLAPAAWPQVVQLLTETAEKMPTPELRARLEAAAQSVMRGERATTPYDHAQAMREYQQAFRVANPPPEAIAEDEGDEKADEGEDEEADDPPEDTPPGSPLPSFRYHPDPLATGSIIESDAECACCGRERGYIYAGPTYAEEELEDCICPWCIADGAAAREFDAVFTDEDGIGGHGWDEVAEEVAGEVARRTPGFSGWQQERWWTHCGDAAAFLGPAGKRELSAFGEAAVAAIREASGTASEDEWKEFFAALDKDGGPTAYVFRCRQCRALGGYWDCH